MIVKDSWRMSNTTFLDNYALREECFIPVPIIFRWCVTLRNRAHETCIDNGLTLQLKFGELLTELCVNYLLPPFLFLWQYATILVSTTQVWWALLLSCVSTIEILPFYIIYFFGQPLFRWRKITLENSNKSKLKVWHQCAIKLFQPIWPLSVLVMLVPAAVVASRSGHVVSSPSTALLCSGSRPWRGQI